MMSTSGGDDLVVAGERVNESQWVTLQSLNLLVVCSGNTDVVASVLERSLK
jgi:hypothetical protein